jgi:transposase InsO family protein
MMIPRMSRPANPYDNANCESFIKTLRRRETDARRYDNLGHLIGVHPTNLGMWEGPDFD